MSDQDDYPAVAGALGEDRAHELIALVDEKMTAADKRIAEAAAGRFGPFRAGSVPALEVVMTMAAAHRARAVALWTGIGFGGEELLALCQTLTEELAGAAGEGKGPTP